MRTNFLSQPIEIIPNKLYWLSTKETPNAKSKCFFFNIDNDLKYEPFFSDFGPLDIGKTCKFVLEVERLLKCSQFADCVLYHHTSLDSAKKTNAAFLMGAFQVIILKKTAESAWEPFKYIERNLVPFRDASNGKCDYNCTILDCLKGLEQAIKLEWFDIRKFDVKSYEHHADVHNGDINWIIPGKLLAFSGPVDKSTDPNGYKRFTPEDYVPIFKKFNIKAIVKLNEKQYDEEKFRKHGFKHYDLFFQDFSCPSDEQIEHFFKICEENKAPIAVHCKAGLGRTGVMIACYAIKYYNFDAKNFIGWIRLCRPGSILGKQQQFLVDKDPYLRGLLTKTPVCGSTCLNFDLEAERKTISDMNKPYVFKCQARKSAQLQHKIEIIGAPSLKKSLSQMI